jgi:DNA-binding FadR family transcriptional regulator
MAKRRATFAKLISETFHEAPDPSMDTPLRRRPRSLALELVEALAERIRRGDWAPGDRLPTEASVMSEFGVSRTVVREAISKLQASGLVETRHGVGTFVLDSLAGASFKLSADQLGTLQDVIAVLELRIGLETEAAALAALRRSDANLATMRQALDAIAATLQTGENAVASDFQFHSEIARATQNAHFYDLMLTLGSQIIPRARLSVDAAERASELAYLRRVQAEHESIYDAIAAGDAEAARAAMRMHLSNSRERRRRSQTS